MNRTYRLLFLALTMAAANTAIPQFPCGNNISTNPYAPVNNQQNEPYFNNDHFLNTFNWFDHTQNTIAGWPYYNMGAFYGQQSGVFPSPYSIAGQSPDYGYLYNGTEADYFPEDGWELLYSNMGTYPDGTILAQSELTLTTLPYVILYNKYKGVIRVFGKTTTDITNNTYKAVEVKFRFKNPQVSNLFGVAQNISNPLDKEVEVTQIAAICNHPNSFQQWFHADFDVAYDPCACYFRSDLQLLFTFIQSSDIRLAGRSISMETDLYNSSSNTVNYGKNFLTDVFKKPGDPNVIAGSIIYKDIDNMMDDYIARMQAIETFNNSDEVKRNKIIMMVAKGLKSGITTYLSTNVLFPVIMAFLPDVIKSVEEIAPNLIQIKIFPQDVKKLLKDLVGKEYDKFVGSLDKKFPTTAPSAPEMPSVIVSEMSFSGNITTLTATGISTLFNPGTFNNNNVYNTQQFSQFEQLSVYNYPVYNEVLGNFALLYTPKMDQYLHETAEPWEYVYDIYNQPISVEQKRSYTLKYKLKEPLQYIFNPAADINMSKTKISAAYILRVNGVPSVGYSGVVPFSGGYGMADGTMEMYNLTLANSNPNAFVNSDSSRFVDYISPMVPLECLSEMTIGFSTSYDIGTWGPVPSYCDFIASLYQGVTYELYVKLVIDYEFNSSDHNGEPNRFTQVLKFRADQLMNYSEPAPPAYNTSLYPENLLLSNSNIPFDTTYQTWNQVRIFGNITQTSNVQALVLGGKKVIVGSNSRITPSDGGKITLGISPVIVQCDMEMPPVSTDDIHTYCTSGDYKAKDVHPNFRSMQTELPITQVQNEIDLDMAANGNMLLLTSSHSQDENIRFVVYDLSGRALYSDIHLPSTLDMSGYSAGMYVLDFTTPGGRAIRKVIIGTSN